MTDVVLEMDTGNVLRGYYSVEMVQRGLVLHETPLFDALAAEFVKRVYGLYGADRP